MNSCALLIVLDNLKVRVKLERSSFSESGDNRGVPNLQFWSRDPYHAPLTDKLHISFIVLIGLKFCVKFERSTLNDSWDNSISKKNDDVTIMTWSGHVTSSVSCPNDRPRQLSYRLSIGTIPLSGFVSEIFSAKVTTTIITWWRHQRPPSSIWWNRK